MTGVVVGGSVLGAVCLECVFVCCMFGVFWVACRVVRGWECYVACEWFSISCLVRDVTTRVACWATYCALSGTSLVRIPSCFAFRAVCVLSSVRFTCHLGSNCVLCCTQLCIYTLCFASCVL